MKYLSNERGNAITILFLLLLPLMLTFMIVSIDHSRSVYGSDLDLQQALNDGCRAAVMQVDPYNQAKGIISVDRDKAYDAFKDVVDGNLRLTDMEVTEDSPISSIDYFMLVPDSDSMWLYSTEYPDGVLCDESMTFQDIDISYDDYELCIETADGPIMVDASTPTVIALACVDLKPVLGDPQTTAVRWSSARVISNF